MIRHYLFKIFRSSFWIIEGTGKRWSDKRGSTVLQSYQNPYCEATAEPSLLLNPLLLCTPTHYIYN